MGCPKVGLFYKDVQEKQAYLSSKTFSFSFYKAVACLSSFMQLNELFWEDGANITSTHVTFLSRGVRLCSMIGLWHCRRASLAGNVAHRGCTADDHLAGKCLFTVSRKMGRLGTLAKFPF